MTDPGEDKDPKARPSPSAGLSSWKEIAAFLNVDVRTCQRWEKSFGLPVHRIRNSERSRVIAYPEEINAWRKTAFATKNGAAAGSNGEKIPADLPAERSAAKIRLKPWAGIVLGLLTVAGVLWAFFPLDRNPADFRIKGSRLIVCNKHGRALWPFDTGLSSLHKEPYYRERFPKKRRVLVDGYEYAGFSHIYFHDKDGDGRNEVLFAPQSNDDRGVGALFLLDHEGSFLWRFDSGKDIVIGGKRYPPRFVINILEVRDVVGDERPEIVVGAHSFMESPAQIAVLDFEKRVLGEYWNFGQLADYEVVDADRDGRKELAVVGTNYEYGQGVLFVLDPERMNGTSPQSPDFRFSGMEEGAARMYIRFAATEIDKIEFTRGVLNLIGWIGDAYLRVESGGSFVYYDFDEMLHPPQITLTDALDHVYRNALQSKQISTPLDRAVLLRTLADGILYFDGATGSWVNRRAMAYPPPAGHVPAALPNR